MDPLQPIGLRRGQSEPGSSTGSAPSIRAAGGHASRSGQVPTVWLQVFCAALEGASTGEARGGCGQKTCIQRGCPARRRPLPVLGRSPPPLARATARRSGEAAGGGRSAQGGGGAGGAGTRGQRGLRGKARAPCQGPR